MPTTWLATTRDVCRPEVFDSDELGDIIESETLLRAFRKVDDLFEKAREALKNLATHLEWVHVSAVVCEVCVDHPGLTPAELIERVRRITKLDVEKVFTENAHRIEERRSRNAGRQQQMPDLKAMVLVLESMTAQLEPLMIESVALTVGMPEMGARARYAYQGLRAFARRHQDWAVRRVRVLGEEYCSGKLPVGTLAGILEMDVPDTVVLLEQCGYSRDLEYLRLSDGDRNELFSRLRADRLARSGQPEPHTEAVARDVIASQRIENVDARKSLSGVLRSSCPPATTTP